MLLCCSFSEILWLISSWICTKNFSLEFFLWLGVMEVQVVQLKGKTEVIKKYFAWWASILLDTSGFCFVFCFVFVFCFLFCFVFLFWHICQGKLRSKRQCVIYKESVFDPIAFISLNYFHSIQHISFCVIATFTRLFFSPFLKKNGYMYTWTGYQVCVKSDGDGPKHFVERGGLNDLIDDGSVLGVKRGENFEISVIYVKYLPIFQLFKFSIHQCFFFFLLLVGLLPFGTSCI